MTGHVEQKVFADHAHQVDAGIANVIFRIILAPARAHVAVDRVQTLRDRAGAVDIGLLGNDNLLVLSPEPCFPSGTRATKACADNKDVDIVFDNGLVSHQ